MKPLVLHIYEKHPDADAYRVGGFYSPYCLVSRDKRFLPGELGAEVWHATYRVSLVDDWRDEGRRARVLMRMATIPHASDTDYE